MAATPLYFCSARPAIEKERSSCRVPRHRHLRPFATVILSGVYEEAGYIGRLTARTGDVLAHPMLDAHENKLIAAGVKLIRLKLSGHWETGGLYRLGDVDSLARLAEKNLTEASLLLEESLAKGAGFTAGATDWPDLLLHDMIEDPNIEMGCWAAEHALTRETVSRGFALAYGVAPSIMRAELRARLAWLRILKGSEYLSEIALDTGFTDQAHMTRWVSRISGASPSVWRQPSVRTKLRSNLAQ